VQAASDMARFRHLQVSNTLTMESGLADRVGGALRLMGHTVQSVNGTDMGGYQAIVFTPDESQPPAPPGSPLRGFYRAGSDHRKDGAAIGY
jgi:gamma-glutamyltranspeptidase/glutathione hydrolase